MRALLPILFFLALPAYAVDVVTIPSVPTAQPDAMIPNLPASEGEDVAEEPPPAPEPAKAPTLAPSPEQPKTFNAVRLRGLNKVTARISDMVAPLGTAERFGTLEIIAKRCWQAPPEEQPENAALLEIRELKPGEGPAQIFSGWMFSSSPGLSGLENAVYDITVLECAVITDQ